jgi:hypothetical protein
VQVFAADVVARSVETPLELRREVLSKVRGHTSADVLALAVVHRLMPREVARVEGRVGLSHRQCGG